MNIVTFLSSFLLSGDQCPTRVIIAAGESDNTWGDNQITDSKPQNVGQCLNTLTDDNKDLLIEFQNHPEYTQSLLNIVNQHNDNILIQVLACGKLLIS